MSLFEGWYVHTDLAGEPISYFYVGESPPGQEYRLDGDRWVSLGRTPHVIDKIFNGEVGWDRCERPDGAPNPPETPKWDQTTGWKLPAEGTILQPSP